MSIVTSNIARIEGTSIIFRTNPVVGIIALTGFVDDATTVIGSDIIKTFRYSTNGVVFSIWQSLTLDNLTAIVLTSKDVFVAEINYRKVPSNSTINATEFSIEATTGTAEIAGFYFTNSLFNRYFEITNIDSLNWYINVLNKLYQKGVVPNFIDRLDDFGSPDDFLALWGAVARFFSFYVELARTFSQFYNNLTLITEFLTQRGLNVSPENTLEELQYILNTYYFQMGERGTVETMGDELLRLIHSKTLIDEYIWCLFRKQHYGWNLGNSSPLYRSLRIVDSLNKAPWSPKYVSLDNSASFSNGTVIHDDDIDKDVLSLSSPGDGISFGNTFGNSIIIDPKLDYQISFKVKIITGTLHVSGVGYANDTSEISLKSKTTGIDESFFLHEAVLSRPDRYTTVRLYLYNQDSGISALNETNIRQGQNLMSVEGVVKLGFEIFPENGSLLIYDIRIVPMITSYSRGFLQSNNFIAVWLLNRNKTYNDAELKDYISKYLIPYNCHLKITELDDYNLSVDDQPTDTLYWVGAGEYCRTTIWNGIDPSCELMNLIWVPDEDTAYCEQG